MLTLVAASVVIFAVLDVLPGNVAQVMLGESATSESLAALQAKLGLDRPPVERYATWMRGLAHGDMGTSHSYDSPVADLVKERALVTVPLAVMAMALTTLIALLLGVYAASHHNRWRRGARAAGGRPDSAARSAGTRPAGAVRRRHRQHLV